MSTFLELTNKALERLNEVPLTSATFATATGFHSVVKEAVNNAIREINREAHEWPFNQKSGSVTTVEGQTFYDFPADAKVLDFDTFALEYDSSGTSNFRILTHISYDSYMKNFYVTDNNMAQTNETTIPHVVFKHGDQFGIAGREQAGDTITFTYWGWSNELVNYDDTTDIPARYDDVILFGTLRECYDFRTMNAQSAKYDSMFYDGIKTMRTQLINDFVAIRDTRIGW